VPRLPPASIMLRTKASGPARPPAMPRAERCGILVRVTPELRRELKIVAAARDTTVQALLLKAIVDGPTRWADKRAKSGRQ
jgi:hypothetical protein